VNSTISGNDSLLGAGAYILTGTLAFDYSTVAANTASGEGGGLHNADMAVVQSSIIAGNSGNGSNTDSAADCASNADITYAGNSLFGDGTGCAATGQNDMNVNPDSVFTSVIKPLADYGGDTETHELQASSPAIDTGNLQFCQDSDQRGYARPIGSACDTGSVEVWKMVFLPVIMK